VQWPEVVRAPGSGALALYPTELLVYVGLTLVGGLWLVVTGLGMNRGRLWGFWWARAFHLLVAGFGAVVVSPLAVYGLYLIVFNPHPGSSRWLDFSDRADGIALVLVCAPVLLLAAFSWRCWLRLRSAPLPVKSAALSGVHGAGPGVRADG
jgi:hypothetical protein